MKNKSIIKKDNKPKILKRTIQLDVYISSSFFKQFKFKSDQNSKVTKVTFSVLWLSLHSDIF